MRRGGLVGTMLIIRKALHFFLLAWGALFLSGIASTAAAQDHTRQRELGESNPCNNSFPSFTALPEAEMLPGLNHAASAPIHTQGLTPADFGTIVYDSNQRVCWLADANLAANPVIRAQLGVAGINPDGTMDYPTALKWVDALNDYDHGRGFLGHNNWQLPDNPLDDSSCLSFNNGGFGALCTGSALGNLYNVGLARTFPDSVVPHFTNLVWPFRNLQPSLYWTQDQDSGGEVTFSFLTALQGANTTKYNYLHMLPMTLASLGTPPVGSGVRPYSSGAAAGKAVYDTKTGISWALDANLAASMSFGLAGTTTITSDVDGTVLTVPQIDVDGAMLYGTAVGTTSQPLGWLEAMNKANFAGTNLWSVPHFTDLQTLFEDLNLQAGADFRLLAEGEVGPFRHFQPFFYWACERGQNGNSQSPCKPKLSPPGPPGTLFAYSFDFDNGFEGTDLVSKQFYVMVYYPAPPVSH